MLVVWGEVLSSVRSFLLSSEVLSAERIMEFVISGKGSQLSTVIPEINTIKSIFLENFPPKLGTIFVELEH